MSSRPPSQSQGSIGVDAIYQFASAMTQFLSGMAFYLIAVRLFSTYTVGAIALFLAVVGIFGVIFSFGVNTAIQHFSSYHLGRGEYAVAKLVVRRLLLYALSIASAGALLVVAFGSPISMLFAHTAAFAGLVRLLALVLLGNVIGGTLGGALLGLQRFRLAAAISMASSVSYYFGAIGLSLLSRSLYSIVYGWMFGSYLGVALGAIALAGALGELGGSGDPGPTSASMPMMGAVLSYSAPILLSNVIGYGATYVDRFVVAGLMTLSSLGVYNFALLIVGGMGFIAVPFNNILVTKLSSLYGAGLMDQIRSVLEASSLLLSALYVPIALSIAALAPMVLELLGGGDYVAGSVALVALMFSSAALVSSNVLGSALASVRRTRTFIFSTSAALAGNAIASLSLIPRLGLLGAAIGYSTAGASSFAVLLAFSRMEGVLSFDIGGMLKVWASSLGTFILLVALERSFGSGLILLLPYLAAAAVFYLALLKALGAFKGEKRELVLSLFPPSYGWLRRMLSILL